jgi:tetratricopeptide (TPR) repeat protein
MKQEECMSHNCEYRCEGKRFYSLYIDEKPANMHILGFAVGMGMGHAVQMPGFWFGDGGAAEKNKLRRYLSLEAAVEGEKALVESISRSGQLDMIMLPPDHSDGKKTPAGKAGNGVIISLEKLPEGRSPCTGGNQRSIEDLAKAIESNPSHVDEYFERAQLYAEKKEYQHAIDNYNRAIEINYNTIITAAAYANKGSVYLQQRDYDAAISDFTKAIEVDPSCVPGYFNRGSAYFMKELYSQAISDLSEAVRLAPELAAAWDIRGDAYARERNYDLAIADYSRAIELGPKLVMTYLKRGEAFYHKKDYEHTIQDYDRAINLGAANDPHAYHNRGCALYKKGDYTNAIADLNEAISLDPNIPEVWDCRGRVYFDKEQYARAIEDFSEAIRLNPDFVNAHQSRDIAYYKMNEKLRNNKEQ